VGQLQGRKIGFRSLQESIVWPRRAYSAWPRRRRLTSTGSRIGWEASRVRRRGRRDSRSWRPDRNSPTVSIATHGLSFTRTCEPSRRVGCARNGPTIPGSPRCWSHKSSDGSPDAGPDGR
jgi:hypothetical protein